jgi:hypothetical protein
VFYPEVATRSCANCRAFLYDEKTGEIRKGRDGQPAKRPDPNKVPCVLDKCPKGHYSKPITNTSFTRQVIALHAQAKATGCMVLNKRERRDRLLAHWFSIIDQINKYADQQQLVAMLTSVFGSLVNGRS